VHDKASLFVEQELTTGGNDSESTRIGIRTALWADSQINVGLDNRSFDGNGTLSTTAGFVQRLQLNDQWTANFTLDRGQSLSSDSPEFGLNPSSPLSSGPGGDSFTAASIGTDWRGSEYYWSNRIEARDSDTVNTRRIDSGLLKELQDGRSLLSSLSWSTTESQTADQERENFVLSVGHANRSNNNVNYNGWENGQISLQYAGKYNLANIDDDEFSGYTDLLGAQYRHDINEKWDIGVRAATSASYNSGVRRYALGASVGWSPVRDTWLELGYNFKGFEDDDFAGSEYTAQGVTFSIRHKFDENSVRRFYQRFRVKDPAQPQINTAPIPVPAAPEPIKAAPIQKPVSPGVPVVLPETRLSYDTVKPKVVIPAVPKTVLRATPREPSFQCEDVNAEVSIVSLASYARIEDARAFLNSIASDRKFINEFYSLTVNKTLFQVNVGPVDGTKEEIEATARYLNKKYQIESWVRTRKCGAILEFVVE